MNALVYAFLLHVLYGVMLSGMVWSMADGGGATRHARAQGSRMYQRLREFGLIPPWMSRLGVVPPPPVG